MNKQAIFNVVATHLLTQKVRSGVIRNCRYRENNNASDPIRCAIGVLIPDTAYNPDLMEGSSVYFDLIKDSLEEIAGGPLLKDDIVFLSALQAIHDSGKVEEWSVKLKNFANRNNLKMPNPEIGTQQYLWLAYLRSGSFKQTTACLHNIGEDAYCCLGIAEAKLGPHIERSVTHPCGNGIVGSFGGSTTVLGKETTLKLKFYTSSGEFQGDVRSLAYLNDRLRYTFEQIADFVEENPRRVFIEAA